MNRRDWVLASGLLFASWMGLSAAFWLIFAVEPRFIRLEFFAPAVGVIVVFVGTMLLASRWSTVWQVVIEPTVPVPSWVGVAAVLTTLTVLVATSRFSVSWEELFWIGMILTGVSLAVSAISKRHWLDTVFWPLWIVVAVTVLLGNVLILSLFSAGNPLLDSVFFLALLLVFFQLTFLLPLTLYQATHQDQEWDIQSYPPVSVLIPAFNEEGVVGGCIESVLETTYPDALMEIIVIDDGSSDGTYAEAAGYREQGVQVFGRDNGGKHAALNYGLQCATEEVIVTVDADSRPDPSAIKQMIAQLQADESIGALSAPVIIQNDDSFIARLQNLEYIISNTNRRAYSVFNTVPIVPGCLGVYRRAALTDVWGYDPDTVAEDFDVTVDILRHGWRVQHGTGVVRTIAPTSWRELWRQRLRWYQGGLETLRKHWEVVTDPRFGYLHALVYPTRYLSHAFNPILSYVIVIAVAREFIIAPSNQLIALAVVFLSLTTVLSLYSMIIEGEAVSLVAYTPLLFVGYKHFIDLAMAVGNILAYLGDRRW